MRRSRLHWESVLRCAPGVGEIGGGIVLDFEVFLCYICEEIKPGALGETPPFDQSETLWVRRME